METINLMLVDDHDEVLRQIGNVLRHDASLWVSSSSNNQDFLERAWRDQPDVILIDPMVNGAFNYAGLAKARKLLPKTEIIVLTSIVDTVSRIELRKYGINRILEKGLNIETLVEELKSQVRI